MKRTSILFIAIVCALVAAMWSGCAVSPQIVAVPEDGGTTDDTTVVFADAAAGLSITPANATINVTYGQPPSTLAYQAFSGSQAVTVSWSLDRGDLGVINAQGVFKPSGTVGGVGTVTAKLGAASASTTVTVNLSWTQNGETNPDGGVVGPGGNGGVGGEGPGQPVSSTTLSVLQSTPIADSGLRSLYPYDATVWPRGLLAPLLQWNVGAQGDYDAVYIHVHEAAFDYKGYFSKTATPFIHHPITQAPWEALTYSNGGEAITVDLVFSKGNVAYGPVSQTWHVAGSLRGTVYYQSYATSLVTNYCCTTKGERFGAAVLGIKHGATSPFVVAGKNSVSNSTGCRGCHSVSVDGSMMLVQQGDDTTTSTYALSTNTEQTTSWTNDIGAFAAIAPNNKMLFSNAGTLNGITPPTTSGLFSIPSGAPISVTGLPAGFGAAMPMFSPNGKHLAFNAYSADQKSLGAFDFDGKSAFSNYTVLDTPTTGIDMFPAYLPTSDAIVFERELQGSPYSNAFGSTYSPALSELWWIDTATKTPAPLRALNGTGYLPTGPNNHGNDAQLNFEPGVNPIASGGYAWVVFTSRRLYGNIATSDPYCSDPQSCDMTASPSPKKLWVAAVDLNAKPGTDPSHPAFYLPAQELMAGNSRGYWVLDPCESDGSSCETGDQCCGGYCESSSDGGLTCGSTPPGCGGEGDHCIGNGDCCSGTQCVGGPDNGHCDGPH